jgi:hypothetical protein
MRTASYTTTVAALFLCLSSPGVSQQSGDLVVSGKLNHRAVLDLPGDADGTVELSAARYIFEVPPSKVGVVQELDQELVESLCRDLEGCRITLQVVNWNTFDAPGGVMSRTSRLVLSETSGQFRFDESSSLMGEDGDEAELVFELQDCKFTDGEVSTGDNGYFDDDVGFGLLNCKNGGPCFLSDTTTTCRVVLVD